MAAPCRTRLGHGLVVALLLVPAWKIVEPLLRPGPKRVSLEASRLGRELFIHQWTAHDSLTRGDGLGPVFNASSCVDCHSQGGPGGGGPAGKNVTVYSLLHPHPRGLPQSGVVHQKAISPSFQESLQQVHPSLPRQPALSLAILTARSHPRSPEVVISQRNTPALFGAGQVDAVANEAIIAQVREHSTAARLLGLRPPLETRINGRAARLSDGRIGRFGWKLEFASLGEFVKAACANELGLSNPGRPQATPLGNREYKAEGMDLTEEQCGLMADFIRSLPAPRELIPEDPELAGPAKAGKSLFQAIGCADCHSESIGSIRGLYSDMLLHDMGVDLESTPGSYGTVIPPPAIRNDKFDESQQPSPSEWRTAPLWGVADSAPYLHDGRAPTLEEATLAHGGEAVDVTERFKSLSPREQTSIVAFLKTLRAPAAASIPGGPHHLAAR